MLDKKEEIREIKKIAVLRITEEQIIYFQKAAHRQLVQFEVTVTIQLMVHIVIAHPVSLVKDSEVSTNKMSKE